MTSNMVDTGPKERDSQRATDSNLERLNGKTIKHKGKERLDHRSIQVRDLRMYELLGGIVSDHGECHSGYSVENDRLYLTLPRGCQRRVAESCASSARFAEMWERVMMFAEVQYGGFVPPHRLEDSRGDVTGVKSHDSD